MGTVLSARGAAAHESNAVFDAALRRSSADRLDVSRQPDSIDRPHLPVLDGVRGLAILLVLTFHFAVMYDCEDMLRHWWLRPLWRSGRAPMMPGAWTRKSTYQANRAGPVAAIVPNESPAGHYGGWVMLCKHSG